MANGFGSKTITDAKWQKACRLIAGGASKNAALYVSGISRSTFSRYLKVCDSPDATDVQRGRLEQYQAALGEDMIALEKTAGGSVAGAMFLLARRYPDTYGDATMTEEVIEKVLRLIAALREGTLSEQEVAEQITPGLAEQLFREARVAVGAGGPGRADPEGG